MAGSPHDGQLYAERKCKGRVLVKGTEVASESYTFVRDLVAAQASQTNAAQNTLRLLSDKIGTRVAAAVAK